MTRLRRLRLAGELVARGMSYIPVTLRRGAPWNRLFFVKIRGLTSSVIPEKIQGSPADQDVFLTEGQAGHDPGYVAGFDDGSLAELALALRRFAFQQMATTRT